MPNTEPIAYSAQIKHTITQIKFKMDYPSAAAGLSGRDGEIYRLALAEVLKSIAEGHRQWRDYHRWQLEVERQQSYLKPTTH